MRLRITDESQPIESGDETRRIRADHQPRGPSPTQVQHVDAAIVRAHAIGPGIGFIPIDDHRRIQGLPLTPIERRSKWISGSSR
jgi:hypothetical protein